MKIDQDRRDAAGPVGDDPRSAISVLSDGSAGSDGGASNERRSAGKRKVVADRAPNKKAQVEYELGVYELQKQIAG